MYRNIFRTINIFLFFFLTLSYNHYFSYPEKKDQKNRRAEGYKEGHNGTVINIPRILKVLSTPAFFSNHYSFHIILDA